MESSEKDTLAPLPSVVRSGSIAISVVGIISFISTLALFIYLSFKLVRWHLGRGSGGITRHKTPGYVFASGPVKFGPAHDAAKLAGAEPTVDAASLAPSVGSGGPRYPNQFIVLIVNLLVADLHQAIAFAISTVWVAEDSITVGTGTCFTQGLFVSLGDLASSCFMSAIAIHTFYSIVYQYRPPHKILYLSILSIWAFVFLIVLLPVAGTANGAEAGGFFVRAGAWCWINKDYGNIRLLTHYIFIFVSIVLSWVLYTAVFLSLRRQHRRGDLSAKNTGYHHPAFLIYPVIYLVCILPLATGRVATMAHHEPPVAYFCFAGVLAASNGWLDVLLFTVTRRSIVFAHGGDFGNEDTGVDTFAFMASAPRKTFGNTIFVRGGREEETTPRGGWWRILGDPEEQAQKPTKLGNNTSQTSLAYTEQNAIQMEIITSVVVEDDKSENLYKKHFPDSTSIRSM
ncbi:hypothetical protein F4808DRAFT_423303 [Astrocystis sublimbata]|nr:hypothetical protein F4808DRAFT_423303 [Astrocystis sublimbata]